MPKILFKIRRPQSTLYPTLHKPFKIKELGILTIIFVKSVSRRFFGCNSHLLIPKLSHENGWFTFLLTARIPARVAKIISEKIWNKTCWFQKCIILIKSAPETYMCRWILFRSSGIERGDLTAISPRLVPNFLRNDFGHSSQNSGRQEKRKSAIFMP